MTFPSLCSRVCFLFVAMPWCLLTAADVAAPDATAILQELDTMDSKREAGLASTKANILSQLQRASASPAAETAFYIDAVEAVVFEGTKGKTDALSDWRKKNADSLRSREMQAALALHLRYLALSIEANGMEKPEDAVLWSLTYLKDFVNAEEILAKGSLSDDGKNLLGKPLGESIFVKYLNAASFLPPDANWELRPGNLAGILEKNVRPIQRKTKNPELLATWDFQLQVEADRITSGRSTFQADTFNSIQRPKLLFGRAQDMAEIGQPYRGVNETLALIRAHPSHPDFETWLAFVRAKLPPATKL